MGCFLFGFLEIIAKSSILLGARTNATVLFENPRMPTSHFF